MATNWFSEVDLLILASQSIITLVPLIGFEAMTGET